jgi:hypothetical protein
MTINSASLARWNAHGGNSALIAFAPPIFIGFHGCPLALAEMVKRSKMGRAAKKNFAKRRAYRS